MSIICFDIDGVITTKDASWEPEFWKKRKPNNLVIKKMNQLKDDGHRIILHTSRFSAECRKETIAWLDKYGVPYDGIFFDKPIYDFVVDDRAVTIEELEELLRKK